MGGRVKLSPLMKWKIRHPVLGILSSLGYWDWEHEFKTCPTGERHCPHYHWHPGKPKNERTDR